MTTPSTNYTLLQIPYTMYQESDVVLRHTGTKEQVLDVVTKYKSDNKKLTHYFILVQGETVSLNDWVNQDGFVYHLVND